MAIRRSHATVGVGRAITARRKLAAGMKGPREQPRDTHEGTEHDRAERRLGSALAEQHRSSDRYDAAVGSSDRLLAAVALHAADEEVAARAAWLRWAEQDDGYHELHARPFDHGGGDR